jgi:hypothetical protein
MSHATKDCWFSPENENKGKSKPGKKPTDKTVMMTTEQLNRILEPLTSRNPTSGTRKVHAFSPVQSDTEDIKMFGPKTKLSKVDTNHYSDEDSIYLNCLTKHKSAFHHDENSRFIRLLKLWEKYMVLSRTVSYVYCLTHERL